MKIVIDIDDKYRDKVQKELYKDIWNMQIMKYVNELTVLPKGHGRLIDADAFIERTEKIYKRTGYVLGVYDIEEEPTIIEADRGE